MDAARSKWTDQRLDDQAVALEKQFARIDTRFDGVDVRFDRLEERIDRRFDSMDRRFDALDDRLGRVQLVMVQMVGGALITALVTFAVAILTRG